MVNSNWAGIVQLPSEKMDRFENIVMVVKDEEQFIKRVLEAVRKQSGECITGDVLADSKNIIRYGSLDKYERQVQGE